MDDADALLLTLPGASVRGRQVYLPIDAALAALDWAEDHGATLLGMEGFHLTRQSTQPSEGHIADFSPTPGVPSDRPVIGFARELLRRWRGEVDAVVLVITTE